MMKIQYKLKLISISLMILLFMSQSAIITALPENNESAITIDEWQNGINTGSSNNNPAASSPPQLGDYLNDNVNEYSMKWDPWKSKAAIRDVAVSENGDFMALASGYLNDYEIEMYRWNYDTSSYDHVSEVGSGIFGSDVTSVSFADTDYNGLIEVIAGSDDGHLYVFEQTHVYDPNTNSENTFDLVWQSDRLGRISDLVVQDTDGDAKKDIIVGTGNTLRLFEYSDHSGYPYDTEHWIEFKEVFSHNVDSGIFITALGVADTNKNGLQEIIVGLENSYVEIYENNGTIIDPSSPFPIVNDNSYKKIWTSSITSNRMVSDIDAGDLDGDGYNEALVAIQGISTFVISSFNGVIGSYNLERGFEDWESSSTNNYPLDYYVDSMVDSSSLIDGVLSPTPNVYYSNATDNYGEPLDLSSDTYQISPFYNSHSVSNASGITTFAGTPSTSAWATYDFGHDEEAKGNGVPSIYDLLIVTKPYTVNSIGLELGNYPDSVIISVSQDGSTYHKIDSSAVTWHYTTSVSASYFEIDVDEVMNDNDLDYYRFLKINTSISLGVDRIKTYHVNNPVFDGRSVEVANMKLSGDVSAKTYGMIGTTDGTLLAIRYEPAPSALLGFPTQVPKYTVVWDSWKEEAWKLDKNMFGIELVNKPSRYPAWMKSIYYNNINGDMSHTIENFYNYEYNDNYEVVSGGETINVSIIPGSQQQVDNSWHLDLNEQLFGRSEFLMNDMPYVGATTINDYISDNGGYYTATVIPIEGEFDKPHFDDVSNDVLIEPTITEERNAFWLMLGRWDGTTNRTENNGMANSDITLWYMTQYQMSEATGPLSNIIPEFCFSEVWDDPRTVQADITMDTSCSFFTPYYEPSTQDYLNLEDFETTGTLSNILKSSVWMPQVTTADLTGSSNSDYIISNGKIHLVENFQQSLPFLPSEDSFNLVYRENYFESINNDEENRIWTQVNPVDFDQDGDMDLIAGFARYSAALFGEANLGYGLTYFENTGSGYQPEWVERTDVMSNNDPNTNFGSKLYSSPFLYSNNYNFPNGEVDSDLGYHPKYKDNSNPDLYMQMDTSSEQMYSGNLVKFRADYSSYASIMVATYPDIKRLQINFGSTNYGYHIFETWSNEEPLNEWTVSISAADLDEDGSNEVIVGDYDNNVYVFEHLRNNTYTPAFKSNNLFRTEEATNSPYQNEEFPGIPPTFTQYEFQHAKQLISGVDLNSNQKKEFIVATDDQIFVYEAIITATGRILDNQYHLIAIIDIPSVPAVQVYPYTPVITAIGTAEDLNQDGRSELIIGLKQALLIFEIQEVSETITDIYNSEAYQREEIFFGGQYNEKGRYDLPGNFLIDPYESYHIEHIVIDDYNNDGLDDLLLAGSDRSTPIWHGFITVVEWSASGFKDFLTFPNLDSLLFDNPINDIDIDDANYNGKKEIIISHTRGISIYEYSSNSNMNLLEHVSANPENGNVQRNFDIFNDEPRNHFDSITLQDGTHMRVTLVKDGNGVYNRYNLDTSEDFGATWTYYGGYLGYDLPDNRGWEQPSLLQTPDGTIWVSWVMRTIDLPNNRDVLSIMVHKVGSGIDPFQFPGISIPINGTNMLTPKIFSLQDTSTYVGVAYYLQYSTATGKSGKISAEIVNEYGLYDPDSNIDLITGYVMSGFDITEVDQSLNLDDPRIGIVWSGYPSESIVHYSPEYDLYYASADLVGGSLAQNYVHNTIKLAMVTETNIFNPSLHQNPLGMDITVVYEEEVLQSFGNIKAIWSPDGGETWRGEIDLKYPMGFDMDVFQEFAPAPLTQQSYTVRTTIANTLLKAFSTSHPVINYDFEGDGFLLNYFFEFEMKYPISMGLCDPANLMYSSFNPVTDEDALQCWTGDTHGIASHYYSITPFYEYDLLQSTKLEVGDTDRDGRHELIVIDENRVKVFEIDDMIKMTYSLKWVSKQYEKQIMDLVISDSNGNGFPEIIVAVQGGTVNSYEVISTTQPILDNILLTEKYGAYTTTQNGLDSWVSSSISIDINSDGTKDFLYSTHSGDIVALNGNNLDSVIYSIQPYGYNNLDYHRHDLHLVNYNGEILVALAYRSTLNLYSITNGSLVGTRSFATNIARVDVADFTNDNYDEILIGHDNGFVDLFDISQSINLGVDLWSQQYFSIDITDIQVFNQLGNLQIAVSYENSYMQLLDRQGGELWNSGLDTTKSILSNFASNRMAIADFNNDGFLDIIAGLHTNIAFNGIDGSMLWSSNLVTNDLSKYGSITQSPVVTDINHDGYLDVIQSMVAPSGSAGFIAIDGFNGNIIWNTTLPTVTGTNNYGYYPQVELIDQTGGNKYLVGLGGTFTSPSDLSNPTNVFLDYETGMVIGSFSTLSGVSTSISLQNTTNTDHAILIGTSRGEVFKYTVHESNLPNSRSIGTILELEAKIGIKSNNLTTLAIDLDEDGVDDLITISIDKITSYDGNELLKDILSPFWSVENVYGNLQYAYLGNLVANSIGKNSDYNLILLFKNEIVILDTYSGEEIYTYSHSYEISSPVLVNFYQNDANLELIFGFEQIGGVSIFVLDYSGSWSMSEEVRIQGHENVIIRSADLNADGELELVTYARSQDNPLESEFIIYTSTFSAFWLANYGGSNDGYYKGYPVDDITVGQFNDGIGDDLLLSFNPSTLPTGLGLPFSTQELHGHHLIMTTNGFTSLRLNGADAYTINPARGVTQRTEVVDINGDSFDDVLIETDRGDIYYLLPGVSQTSSIAFDSNKFDSKVVPYVERTLFRDGICQQGVTKGSIMVTSQNTLTCFEDNDLSFTTPIWEVGLNINKIQSIIQTTMVGPGLDDDLIVIGEEGNIFILHDEVFDNIIAYSSWSYENVTEQQENSYVDNGFIIRDYLLFSFLILGVIYVSYLHRETRRFNTH